MKISVVVLNRDRLKELGCCLLALQQQSIRDFELVVVTNQPERVEASVKGSTRIRVEAFSDRNVSAARNVGVRAAVGDIIAFCDDDAVPEPSWLERLTAPFSDGNTGGVGGLVRGRNGVSVQWGAQEVDEYGNDWPLTGQGTVGRVIKTVGTNCAFRRRALAEIGGFDESYRYFLDETDADLRLAKAGWALAFEPLAEVHHSYSAGLYRNHQRVPSDLFEIGASKAYFYTRHCRGKDTGDDLRGFVKAQRNRLFRLMHLGLVAPSNVAGILESLHRGLEAGAVRSPKLATIDPVSTGTCRPFPEGPIGAHRYLAFPPFERAKGRKMASDLVNDGFRVSLFEYSRTGLMTRVWLHPDGYWIHRGGIYGRTDRTEPILTVRRVRTWIEREENRIRQQRLAEADCCNERSRNLVLDTNRTQ